MLRRGIEALVGTALVVAMLAVLPAMAEAQSITTTQEEARDAEANRAARVVVVEPGDCLWSISAERLGAGATPQQVAKGVERIYAINQDQIGPNPNLIFVGQRLSMPVAMGSVDAARLDAKATTPSPTTRPAAREGGPSRTAAAALSPKEKSADHATRTEKAPTLASEANQPSRPAPRTPAEAALAEAKPEKAPAPVGETPGLPKESDAAPAVPAVRQAASEEDSPTTTDSPLTPLLRSTRSVVASAASELGEILTEVRETVASASERRTTLGWAIVVLTVTVGALMAWKLPMRRTTRSDAERWGIPTGYYGGGPYPSRSGNRPPHESPALEAPVASWRTTNNGSPRANGARANDSKANGSGAKDLAKRRQLSRRAAAAAAARGSGQSVVRKGLVSGVNSAEFHHALRILPNRRRRHRKPPNGKPPNGKPPNGKPPNGGIRAAHRRIGGRR